MKTNLDLIDFHSHILQGVDHGSHSITTSKMQLNLAFKYGVSRIISTSHFYPHMHLCDAFLKKRNDAYKALINEDDIPPIDIRLGAEVLLCDNLQNFDNLESLCISGTKVLLLELPFSGFNCSMVESVEEIVSRGIQVILAHADRYSKDNIEQLIDVGAKIQLNASALDTFFKKKHLYSWLESGLVYGIGSDIHGKDERAYKRFANARKKIGDAHYEVVEKSNEIWNNSSMI